MNNITKIYALIFTVLFTSIIYLYKSVTKTEEELRANMEKLFITQAHDFSNNIDRYLQNNIQDGNFYEQLKNNKNLREKLEASITTITSESFKYAFVIYKDNYGDYRYLLDGSKEDKAEFNQLFGTVDDMWDKVYKSGTNNIIQQHVLEQLWVTYLNPIVINGKVKAIVAIDFSIDLLKDLNASIKPIKDTFIYIFSSIAILFTIMMYQVILNYRIKAESFKDPLTKAYNRHFLHHFQENEKLSDYQLAIMDIDYFKNVNDTYGHGTGDYILQQVTKIINMMISPQDILIRYGGEEFLLFVKKGDKDILEVAESIRKNVQVAHFQYDKHDIKITISLGITLNIDSYQNLNEAIKHADTMLYRAKKEGRNRVVSEKQKVFKIPIKEKSPKHFNS